MRKIENDFPILEKTRIVNLETKKQNYGDGILFGERICNFIPKRIFYIYDVNSSMNRGNHANINTTMGFVVLKGHCKIVIDDGQKKQAFVLDKYSKALICSPMTWKEMSDFSSDCILMVICDTYFDADDYIDDYHIFKETCLRLFEKQQILLYTPPPPPHAGNVSLLNDNKRIIEIQLNAHSDIRGKLISLEALKNVPFVLKQICFIYNTMLDESSKEQMIVAISGSCQFILEQGIEQIKVSLDRPDLALYAGNDIRCKLKSSSKNCRLLVLSPIEG